MTEHRLTTALVEHFRTGVYLILRTLRGRLHLSPHFEWENSQAKILNGWPVTQFGSSKVRQNRIQIHGTRVQLLCFPSYLSEVSLQWRLTIDISVQFSLVAQSCPTLCDPVNHSTPGLPVHHQLPESTQTHVHWVSKTIQPSDPLSTPSPPAFSLS